MDSVFSLTITKENYDPYHPYKSPKNEEIIGSGFIIDISKGLVVTTSKLVENSISIIGKIEKLGKRDISLELLGICREKDLAICKILDIDLLKKNELKFDDSMNINLGDSITVLQHSKKNIGSISSFVSIENNSEDSYTRDPTYIEITTHGIQGSPVLNSRGKVIGIISSKSSNLAIPSRTLLAIYSELISSEVVKMPTLSMEWCKTNRDLMKKQTGSSSTYGIYVRKINPDSCLDKLEKGDIIRRLDYMDISWDPNKDFDIKNISTNNLVSVYFDRFGMTTTIGKIKNPDEIDDDKIELEKKYTERSLSLSEVVDMIPIGSELTLNMCRNGSWYKLKTSYIFMNSDRITSSKIYDYEIFCGICFTNLDINHKLDKKFGKSVVISQVFPGTDVYKTQVFKSGQLIKSMLAYNDKLELIEDSNRIICNLDDIRHILHLRPSKIQITTTDEYVFMTSIDVIKKEDKKILSDYKIFQKYIID